MYHVINISLYVDINVRRYHEIMSAINKLLLYVYTMICGYVVNKIAGHRNPNTRISTYHENIISS
ncbi:hypothetical protein SAMN05216334_12433 [Nitrosomonas ureae]|uniref:Uncharacterized protein n=1 Tax=Nitrosomonas ureae TaxID=44577 RepID=A0A1H5X6E2_9PROT|nr:hypothetical protein SAMN05216334_12433 [Nitrosomonas ureae]